MSLPRDEVPSDLRAGNNSNNKNEENRGLEDVRAKTSLTLDGLRKRVRPAVEK